MKYVLQLDFSYSDLALIGTNKEAVTPINASLPNVGGVNALHVTLFIFLQFEKALDPTVVTLDGMIMLVNCLQFAKACFPIEVIPSGITTFSNDIQLPKVKSLTTVIFSGIISSFVIDEQSKKADEPNDINPSGNLIFVMLLHRPKASCPIVVTEEGIFTFDNCSHPSNAYRSIFMTSLGITTFFNELHRQNRNSLIVVIFFGNMISFRTSHSIKALLPMTETFSGILILESEEH